MEKTQNKRGQKLFYYLSRLKEKELDDLHDYFQSPLLGNSPQFARMLLIIRDKVLNTDRTTIDADLFNDEFFPGQTLDEKQVKYIRIRLVQFLDKVMDFASFMDYRSDRNAKDIHLLKAMYKRGWEKHFEKVHAEVEAKPAIKEDGEYLMYKLWRQVILNDYLNDRNTFATESNIAKLVDSINDYSIHLNLKYACSTWNVEMNGGKKVEMSLLANSLEIASDNSNAQPVETQGYLNCFYMIESIKTNGDGDKPFQNVKQILEMNFGGDHSEFRDLFYYANNYCLKKIRLGYPHYRKEILTIYETALRGESLFSSGLMKKLEYKNAVMNMCRIGEVEWADLFVEEWKDRIAGDNHRLGYHHNKAYIYLVRKEYDKTIALLYNRLTEYDDALYGLSTRVNLCRALWGKSEYQWLLSNLEAMRQFVIRLKDLPKIEKSGNEIFIKYLTRMCLAKLAKPERVQRKLQSILTELLEKEHQYRFSWVHNELVSSIGETNSK